MIKSYNGGDVYAYTAVPTELSIFNKGRDYITADGKIYTIATAGGTGNKKITKVTEKSAAPENDDYLAGKLGDARIASYAFEGAINLETVEFYGDVTLGTGVFNNCPKLKSITVMQASTMDKFANVDDGNVKGVLYQGSYVEGEDGNYTFVPKTLIQFPSGAEVEEFIVPETVEDDVYPNKCPNTAFTLPCEDLVSPTKGKVISIKPLHPLKQDAPIIVTLFGITTVESDTQFSKALSPILVTS
jgi:hypothetical protein